MRILLLNQAFYPDVVSSGQHASDLALRLAESGHEVTVIASRSAYDDPAVTFPARETWHGVRIIRVGMLRLGKASRWRRALNFASFLANCFARMLLVGRFDLVIALTSPPLISALGAFLVQVRGGKFISWVMDLNPDEAIAAGWIRPDSAVSRLLAGILRYSLKHSACVVALDRFMARRLADKGVPEDRIAIIPPWSHDEALAYDPAGRDSFRKQHELEGKFVVMYSGNHSPCHPLTSVLEAAALLKTRDDIAFCFVGGGSEFRGVQRFAAERKLPNIRCIPYQPLNRLAASLSAADLHLVVMGEPFVGMVHPCKVYNIRHLGIPFLYVGPEPSHVTELSPAASFRHGDVEGIRRFLSKARPSPPTPDSDRSRFAQRELAGRMVSAIESVLQPAGTAPSPQLPSAIEESR